MCLDLFATIGALRNAPDEEVVTRFVRAFAENPDIAVKTLFIARDIRGGLGERKVFRTILEYMTTARRFSRMQKGHLPSMVISYPPWCSGTAKAEINSNQ